MFRRLSGIVSSGKRAKENWIAFAQSTNGSTNDISLSLKALNAFLESISFDDAIAQFNTTDKLTVSVGNVESATSVTVVATNTSASLSTTATKVGNDWEIPLSILSSEAGNYTLDITATTDTGASSTLTLQNRFNVCTGSGRPSNA